MCAVAVPPSAPAGVASVRGCALWGLETALVTVEVDVANGLPNFTIVGLPDAAVREARERVRSAIRNSGCEFPLRRVTVNLAPAERRKEGTGFDLAIALGILRASGQLSRDPDGLCLGELSLDGALRGVPGAMPRVRRAVSAGIVRVYVAPANAAEAAVVGAEAIAVPTLRAAIEHIDGRVRLAPARVPAASAPPAVDSDIGDIAGQQMPKRALEVAAAGGHNLLLIGPPGTGKTLLAKALPGIMPPLGVDESLLVTAIHSVAGLIDPERPLLVARPFRAPHHTASRLSLVGGGTPPRPGEVTLSHGGTLFLDELPEFSPHVLDTLREPLEEGAVTISRAGASATYPARFTLVAAMNPCPCGHAGDIGVDCRCLPDAVDRYRGRISGPLLDRIDLRVAVRRVPYDDLRDAGAGRERSAAARERVIAARERMNTRLAGTDRRCNAELRPGDLRQHVVLSDDAERLIGEAVRARRLSARAYHRLLRVALTVADLAGASHVRAEDLAFALLLRAQA